MLTSQVSEGCLYAQLVDRFDSDRWESECQPPFNKDRCSNYAQLFRAVSRALFRAHVQSTLKSEVMQHIERFVNFDPEASQALANAAGRLGLLRTSTPRRAGGAIGAPRAAARGQEARPHHKLGLGIHPHAHGGCIRAFPAGGHAVVAAL